MAVIKVKNPEYVEGESNKWIPISTFVQSESDKIVTDKGDGTKYLSDDGTYKEVITEFTETDPVFSASAAAGIKSSDISNWNSKTSNIGTITGIKMNGASKGTSGVVDLGTVITSHQDISGKLDKTTAASTYLTKTDAATTYLGISAKAVDATKADSATKATQDASGNIITTTYATKTELSAKVSGDGNILNIVKVTALPSSPDANTLYVIVES